MKYFLCQLFTLSRLLSIQCLWIKTVLKVPKLWDVTESFTSHFLIALGGSKHCNNLYSGEWGSCKRDVLKTIPRMRKKGMINFRIIFNHTSVSKCNSSHYYYYWICTTAWNWIISERNILYQTSNFIHGDDGRREIILFSLYLFLLPEINEKFYLFSDFLYSSSL